MKILFCTSEAYPLVKTGGLGDVSNSLPNALVQAGLDVRLVLPGYRAVLHPLEQVRILGWLPLSGAHEARILEARHPAFKMPLWIIDLGPLFDRPSNPYTDAQGQGWSDNALRFTLFSEACAKLAMDALDLNWQADVVHCNDWQTGLVSAFVKQRNDPPRCIYTIHNIAYDEQIDYGAFQDLHLPAHWWSVERGEFYGRFSLMKAALMSTDVINTVSPTYAQEICTSEYGYGYAGILQANRHKLCGILNGIDTDTWNPASDPMLSAQYRLSTREKGRQANRDALLLRMAASAEFQTGNKPLIGFVGRFAHQKGIDLLLDAIRILLPENNAQFVLLGTGDVELEGQVERLSREHADKVCCYIGYDEAMAHLLEAACDAFVMPSRYEPCGLNQLYSLRYGTPPIVRKTGGLADTVRDASLKLEPLAEDDTLTALETNGNGFVFDQADAHQLAQAIERMLDAHRLPHYWQQVVANGMNGEYGWQQSARNYSQLYQSHSPIPAHH